MDLFSLFGASLLFSLPRATTLQVLLNLEILALCIYLFSVHRILLVFLAHVGQRRHIEEARASLVVEAVPLVEVGVVDGRFELWLFGRCFERIRRNLDRAAANATASTTCRRSSVRHAESLACARIRERLLADATAACVSPSDKTRGASTQSRYVAFGRRTPVRLLENHLFLLHFD